MLAILKTAREKLIKRWYLQPTWFSLWRPIRRPKQRVPKDCIRAIESLWSALLVFAFDHRFGGRTRNNYRSICHVRNIILQFVNGRAVSHHLFVLMVGINSE